MLSAECQGRCQRTAAQEETSMLQNHLLLLFGNTTSVTLYPEGTKQGSDPSLSSYNVVPRKAEMCSRNGWVAHHVLLLITIGLALIETHPGVHAQECQLTLAEKCPSYTCFAPEKSNVSFPVSLPRETVVVCRETRAPDCVDILRFKSGSTDYYRSTFKGYVFLSSNAFTATLHRWLEGRYQIKTAMDKKCIANVDLSTTSPSHAGGEQAPGSPQGNNSATQTWSLSMGNLVAMYLLLVLELKF